MRLMAYFTAESAALSVTFDANVTLDDYVYDGIVRIDRQGKLTVQIKHE